MSPDLGNIPGLRALIKVGGSLGRGEELPALCKKLDHLSRSHRLLIIPGGGQGADCVRDYDRRFGLCDDAAHWMAILAMDQYGLLLEELIPGGRAVSGFAGAAQVLDAGGLPILLPYALLKQKDPLPHSWQVTSDSIAAWAARESGAHDLVLLKDVDGLYETGLGDAPEAGRLLPELDLDGLARSSGVDPFLASLINQAHMGLWVINGARPERLAEFLESGSTLGTRLLPPGT